MVYSVLHQKGVFDELGDLPQPASQQYIPMAQAVLLPPGAATGFPTAESVPLTPMLWSVTVAPRVVLGRIRSLKLNFTARTTAQTDQYIKLNISAS